MKALKSAAGAVVGMCLLWSATALGQQAGAAAPNDLDAFMAQVLERRNDAWRTLHDYILSERESFELRGPSEARLFGGRREFTWFVRDGYLIRSPLRFNGVALGDRERQDYEQRWLSHEQQREKDAAQKDAEKKARAAQAQRAADKAPGDGAPEPEDAAALIGRGLEPRFISEAYFMQFKFDPGNYYLAGRETLEGRRVLRIEYYPKRMYSNDKDRDNDERERERETRSISVGADGSVRSETKTQAATPSSAPAERRPREQPRAREKDVEKDFEKDMERRFNKVALITLWVDPVERQIVKYTFENTELNFLPGRWLARVGEVSASMTMGQPIGSVWLPRAIEASARVMLANGDFDGHYLREFYDYRQGEVKARIRSYSPGEN